MQGLTSIFIFSSVSLFNSGAFLSCIPPSFLLLRLHFFFLKTETNHATFQITFVFWIIIIFFFLVTIFVTSFVCFLKRKRKCCRSQVYVHFCYVILVLVGLSLPRRYLPYSLKYYHGTTVLLEGCSCPWSYSCPLQYSPYCRSSVHSSFDCCLGPADLSVLSAFFCVAVVLSESLCAVCSVYLISVSREAVLHQPLCVPRVVPGVRVCLLSVTYE